MAELEEIEEKTSVSIDNWTDIELNKTKKKRVALFADVLEENFDGVSVTLNKILDNLPRERFEILIITSHPPKDLSNFDHKIILLPYVKVPAQKGYRLGLPSDKVLKPALEEFEPDLIHFTSPSLFGRYAIKYGKANNIPVLNIYHTHYPAYFKYYIGNLGNFLFGGIITYLVMWFYRNSDYTLAPTRTIKLDLIKSGIKSDRIKVWGRAVKTDTFSPVHRDERYFNQWIPHDQKKVLFVSRLIKEKEMTTIVKVYKLLQKWDPKVTMIITGDGPKKEYLEKRMTNAVFTGKKTGKDLSQIYASCDIFFFPSASETFGNVVMEAMASGLPVVAANAGGPAELVRDNKTGFLVKTGKAKLFAKKILEILNDTNKKRIMSLNALEAASPRTSESVHQQLWNYYDKAISSTQKC